MAESSSPLIRRGRSNARYTTISNNIIDNAGSGIYVSNYPGRRVIVSNNQITNMVIHAVLPGFPSIGRGISAEKGTQKNSAIRDAMGELLIDEGTGQ